MSENIADNDDAPVGRVLSRREVLALLAGAGGALLLAACDPFQSGSAQPTSVATQTTGTASSQPASAPTQTPTVPSSRPTSVPTQTAAGSVQPTAVTSQASPTANVASLPACVVRPEETEGPYFVDEKLNRSDIRSDPSDGLVKDGLPLLLVFRVSDVSSGCIPLQGVQIDVWHCDALGVYSDTNDPSWNTVGKKFLRGYQVTDANGVAQFTTIYPGWYRGRAVHIHFKIRTTTAAGKSYDFTSQLYFDDSLTDQVHAQQPYASKGRRDTTNSRDGIYQSSGGSQLLLNLSKSGQGYATTFDIGLQMA
jgi:protocatechuate 3,4-dioxygenase beta subunit